jgi:hypothetical protein
MSSVRRFGILILGIILLAVALGAIAFVDYVDVVTPPETSFIPPGAVSLQVVRTYVMDGVLIAGLVMIAIWIGSRVGRKSVGLRRSIVTRYWVFALGIVIAAGASFTFNSPCVVTSAWWVWIEAPIIFCSGFS